MEEIKGPRRSKLKNTKNQNLARDFTCIIVFHMSNIISDQQRLKPENLSVHNKFKVATVAFKEQTWFFLDRSFPCDEKKILIFPLIVTSICLDIVILGKS